MKLKFIALAAMLAASGAAQARIADSNDNQAAGTFTSGDLLFSLVSNANGTSFNADLGLRLDQFAAAVAPSATGISLVWNLRANTFTDLSVVSTGLAANIQPASWSSVYNTFATGAILSDANLKFDIKALDGVPASFAAAGSNRFLSTSASSTVTPTNFQVFSMDVYDAAITAYNNDTTNSTHGTDFNTAGAGQFDTGDASNVYFQNTGDNWFGATNFTSTGQVGQDLDFYALTNSSSTAANAASVTKYIGAWAFNADTSQLSYTAAPIPEAETYAMMLAGLGLVGFMVRRRRTML